MLTTSPRAAAISRSSKSRPVCLGGSASSTRAVTYYENRGILVAEDADQPAESVTVDLEARLSGFSVIRGA